MYLGGKQLTLHRVTFVFGREADLIVPFYSLTSLPGSTPRCVQRARSLGPHLTGRTTTLTLFVFVAAGSKQTLLMW